MAEERNFIATITRDTLNAAGTLSVAPRKGGTKWAEATNGGTDFTVYDTTGAVEAVYNLPSNVAITSMPRLRSIPGTTHFIAGGVGTGSGTFTWSGGSFSFGAGDAFMFRFDNNANLVTVWFEGSAVGQPYELDVNAAGKVMLTIATTTAGTWRLRTVDMSVGAGSTLSSNSYIAAAGDDFAHPMVTEAGVTAILTAANIFMSLPTYTLRVDSAGGTSFSIVTALTNPAGAASAIAYEFGNGGFLNYGGHAGNDLVLMLLYQFATGSKFRYHFYRVTGSGWNTFTLLGTIDIDHAASQFTNFGNHAPCEAFVWSTDKVGVAYIFQDDHTIDGGAGYSATKPSGYDGGVAIHVRTFPGFAFDSAHVAYIDADDSPAADYVADVSFIKALVFYGTPGGTAQMQLVVSVIDQVSPPNDSVNHVYVQWAPSMVVDEDISAFTTNAFGAVYTLRKLATKGWSVGSVRF